MPEKSSRRWGIAILIAGAIAISYFDRQTLSVAIKAIQNEIPITNTQFSELNNAFLIAYAAMYMGGGRLIDVLGVRTGFALIMAWWSLASASHALASGFRPLVVSRFLLGIGEGGGFPAATKAVAEWFPARERSTAMGIINGATAIGAMTAPPIIAVIIASFGWRWIFVFSGAMGLLWIVWWMRSYFTPANVVKVAGPAEPWLPLLANRHAQGIVLAKTLTDAAWYFYLFWLPKYLYDARGFDTKQASYFVWIPYAAAGLGSLLGGWFSSRMIQQGRSVNFSRKLALGLSAACMPWVFFVTHLPVGFAIVLFSLAFFGQQSWSTLVMILPTDLFPHGAVGSVAGLVGFGGAIGGVLFSSLVGYLLDHGFGYDVVFALASSFHVIAFCIIMATVRKIPNERVAALS